MILTLSSGRVRDVVFTDEHGIAMYKSETPFRPGVRRTILSRQTTLTAKNSASGDAIEVVGHIDWHFFGSSDITVGGMNLKSNDFLPSHGFLRRKRTFTGPDGRPYIWDIKSDYVKLSLDDELKTEIARYHKATLGIRGKWKNAYLEIAPQAEHMLDLIILTFIYVEKLRIDRERILWTAHL